MINQLWLFGGVIAVPLDQHVLILNYKRLPIRFYWTPGGSFRLVFFGGIYHGSVSFMISVAFKIGEGSWQSRMDIHSLVGNQSLLMHTDLATIEHFFRRTKLRVDNIQTFVELCQFFLEGTFTLLQGPHLLPLKLLLTMFLLLIFIFDLTDFVDTFLFIVLYSILWFAFRPPDFILHFSEFLVVLLPDEG